MQRWAPVLRGMTSPLLVWAGREQLCLVGNWKEEVALGSGSGPSSAGGRLSWLKMELGGFPEGGSDLVPAIAGDQTPQAKRSPCSYLSPGSIPSCFIEHG